MITYDPFFDLLFFLFFLVLHTHTRIITSVCAFFLIITLIFTLRVAHLLCSIFTAVCNYIVSLQSDEIIFKGNFCFPTATIDLP